MGPSLSPRRPLPGLFAIALLLGCGESTINPVPIASVMVSPDTATLHVGVTRQLTATPLDAAGNPLPDRTVAWISSDTTAARVDTSGIVTALAPGGVQISATSDGVAGHASLAVIPVPVASVALQVDTATLLAGATHQMEATLRDAGGNLLSDRTITWSSSNEEVATVSASGLVRGISAGATTVTASSEGQQATAQITVERSDPAKVSVVFHYQTHPVEVGSTVPAVATVTDASGRLVPGTPVSVAVERGESAPASGITDAAGQFLFQWTMPTTLPPIDPSEVSLTGPIRWDTRPADTIDVVVTAGGASERSRLIVAPGAPIGILPFDPATATMKVGDPYMVIRGYLTTFDQYDNAWNVLPVLSVTDDREDADVVRVFAIVFRCTPWPCNHGVQPEAPGVAEIIQTYASFTSTLRVTVLPPDS
jgi:hypothetical protein